MALCSGSTFTVTGDSMRPTLEPGDTVEVLDGYYEKHAVARDDVVAIRLATRRIPLVKRAVAVAGERAAVRAGRLHVGKKSYPLPRQASRVLAKQLARYNHTVPRGHLIALGDNPKASLDSAALGLISDRQLLGKVVLPPKR